MAMVLIKCDGGTGEITIKIADFGISSSADESELIYKSSQENIAKILETFKVHGTLPYMAPELFAAKEGVGLKKGRFCFQPPVDIFALGVTFTFMFCYNNNDFGKS